MRYRFVVLAAVLVGFAAPAFGQLPRTLDPAYVQPWTSPTGSGYNLRTNVGNISSLTEVYRYSTVGVTWPWDALQYSISIAVGPDNKLYITAMGPKRITKIDPQTMEQQLYFNYGHDAPEFYGATVFGHGMSGKPAVAIAADAVTINWYDDAGNLHTQEPWGVDVWGHILAYNENSLIVASMEKVDNPLGGFLRRLDLVGSSWVPRWALNSGTPHDLTGALARYTAGTANLIFYGPHYLYPANYAAHRYPDGIYAVDAATGAQVWYQATSPWSNVTSCVGLIFCVESTDGTTANLVCRSAFTGTTIWKQPWVGKTTKVGTYDSTGALAMITMPAPPLDKEMPLVAIRNYLIVPHSTQIICYDRQTGNILWAKPWVPSRGVPSLMGMVNSNTLLVLQPDKIQTWNVNDGSLLSEAVIYGTPVSMAARGDRVYVLSQLSGGIGITCYEDTRWLAPGYTPRIYRQPRAVPTTAKVGQVISFSCYAEASPPYGYQWYLGTAPIAGATKSWLDLKLTADMSGKSVSCQITNGLGMVKSVERPIPALAL